MRRSVSHVLAGAPRTVPQMGETHPRGSSAGAVRSQRYEDPLDDWLGDVSDDDWSAGGPEPAGRRSPSPASYELGVPEDDLSRDQAPGGSVPPRDTATAQGDSAAIRRRRLVAVLGLVAIAGLAGVVAVVLLRGGDQAAVTPVAEPTTTTAPTETSPSPSPDTPSTTEPTTTEPTTEPTTTEPTTSGTDAFTLPEGTKLQLGEGDAALIRELQQALTAAGYQPGTADGTFGPQTEAAVAAFQEANGLSVDGRVGPETAAALNSALRATEP